MQQIGISVASRSGLSPTRLARAARASEEAGCTAFLVSERVADAITLGAVALAATSRITVGTGVANAAARHPVLTAISAATLADAYDGRFVLGLGTANRDLNHRVLGLPRTRELAFMREYTAIVRAVLSGSTDRLAGEVFQVGPVPLDRPPGALPVPLWLAGLLPRMLELAGEVADGVILNLAPVARIPVVAQHIAVGARRAGRDPAGIPIACLVPCCLHDDPETARAAGREVVLGYAGHPAAARLFQDSGFGAEIAAVSAALAYGDRPGAATRISDDMVDAFVLCGDGSAGPQRLDAYRAAGVDLPILFPMPVDGDWEGAIDRGIQLAAHSLSRKDSPQWSRSTVQAV